MILCFASKIKQASGFFRIQDARAALPQNCSISTLKLLSKSENGTRVPSASTNVLVADVSDYKGGIYQRHQ